MFPANLGIHVVAHPLGDALTAWWHERDHETRVAGPAGTTRTVCVVLVVVGQVVVQHEAHVVHVDAACGDIGGYECLDLAALEVVERALPHCLAASAMKGAGLDSGAVEVLAHIIDAIAGFHEHHRWSVLLDQRDSSIDAFGRTRHHEAVIHRRLVDIFH